MLHHRAVEGFIRCKDLRMQASGLRGSSAEGVPGLGFRV